MIRLGSSTFPKAMAMPNRNVPISKFGMLPNDRMMMPPVSNRRETNNVISRPYRRASFGANGEIKANASKGIVVKNPANTLGMAKLSRMKEINGPTVVKGDRKVEAIKTMPMINSQLSHENFNFRDG